MIRSTMFAVLALSAAIPADAQPASMPLFVCENLKGYSYYHTDQEKGWVEDGFTAIVAVYPNDIVILRKDQEPFSTKGDGAEIVVLNNMNKRTGGAMIAGWAGGAITETYRIVPDGSQFELYMTQSKHSPMGNGVDKVSSYVGPCVAYEG